MVKSAILDQTGISPETYRQRLRRERYMPGARPRAVAQQIRDLSWRWLEPERWTSVQIAEAVALEQFLQTLPTRGKEWVQRHRPGSLAEATSLMEDYLAAEGEPKTSPKGGGGGSGERNLNSAREACKVDGGRPRQCPQPSGTPMTRSAKDPSGSDLVRSERDLAFRCLPRAPGGRAAGVTRQGRIHLRPRPDQGRYWQIPLTPASQEKTLNLSSSLDIEGSSAAVATMQSSPAEMAVQSNRKRAPAWTDREVLDLIAVWGDESVLSELRSKRRNAKIYEKISKAMAERGYSRDATQCRVKIKELRQGYQKTKEANGRSGSQPHTSRFYEALHSILGAAATTTPPLTVDSEDGIMSDMTADGEEEEGDEEDEAVDSAGTADFPDTWPPPHPHSGAPDCGIPPGGQLGQHKDTQYESVLAELRSSKRNGKILEKVSRAMKDRGHNRDTQQCRVKIKELRQAYHKAREANGRSGAEPQTCRFYAELYWKSLLTCMGMERKSSRDISRKLSFMYSQSLCKRFLGRAALSRPPW
uniref:SCAN box domain-containing protein n=1 Tax=Terrapene triunguis TaxID=2587831 RepID=A0A674IGI7_9SAUR